MYEYPYGNSQQLNLDWILNKVKEFENSGASSADMKSIANALLSASYDAGSAYAVNDVVYNDTLETLYICNTAIPVGGEPWDATHWDAFRVGEVLTFLFNTIQNLPSDNIANNSNVTGTGLTAALNALVEDVRYNNHYLQQKKNGVYTDVIPIEDTPSNNSDRLASSKAAYDLKGATTLLESAIGIVVDGDSASAIVNPETIVFIKNNTHGLNDGIYKNISGAIFPISGGTADVTVFSQVFVGLGGLFTTTNLFHKLTNTYTTSASGNANITELHSSKDIIVAVKPPVSTAVGFWGKGTNGVWYVHVVDSSGTAITNTEVALDIYYVSI